MKTSSLTVILYLLLAGFVLLAGWKACEIKKQKAFEAREAAASTQSDDLGYIEDDSTEASTYAEKPATYDASYKDGSTEKSTKTAVPAPATTTAAAPKSAGIEGDDTAAGRTAEKPVTASTPTKKPTLAKPATSNDDAEDGPKTTAKSAKADPNKGRYWVVAGAFKQMDGARAEMEKLVKLGFTEAAALPAKKHGAYGYAVAKRANSQADADKILAQVKAKGYKDAYVKKMW